MKQPPSPRLLRAYGRTLYRAGSVVIRIGARSPAVLTLLRRHAARSGTLITAWNPMSRRMPRGWNDRLQRSLAQRLRRAVVIPAQGGWRNWQEDHLLVLGSVPPVVGLARLYRQRAIVVLSSDGAARLVLI